VPESGDTVELDAAEIERAVRDALREARTSDLRRFARERSRDLMGHDRDERPERGATPSS
jgi:hypothetical protein